MNSLDTNTLQLISTIIIDVLMILMLIIWLGNKYYKSNMWWGIFSISLAFDSTLSCFTEIRNMDTFVYVFNIIASLTYFSLSMGMIEFTRTKIDRRILYFIMASCIIINLSGAYIVFSDELRRAIIIGYNTIFLMISIYAISKISSKAYLLEKNSMLFLLIAHIGIHAYWASIDFKISGIDHILFSQSVTPIYIILFFVMINLLLLTLGRIRNQLEKENEKSIAMKEAVSRALIETNVANKSKPIFLTNMSHELRTPLNIIIGFSDALKLDITGPLNEKQRGFVENIHFAGNRLLNLINDLLDLSNIESGNLPPDLEKIRLRDLLSNHVKDLMRHANNYGITLNVIDDLDEIEGLVYVHGNNDWIAQILMALTDNAAKYGNKNGNIWINAFQNDKDTIRITVKDEGHGIAENEIKNVFKPFNRAGVDSKAIEGTGAGLTIVKSLVDAMNGNIDFTTQYGSGTTFWIDLPIKSI